MNVFAPEDFFEGESINGYTTQTAPILVISTSGGYRPGAPADLRSRFGEVVKVALSKGYVVAGPGARGHSNKDPNTGSNNGKAPAGIVDLKAAVRYLRHNDKAMPGDAGKIISTGSSARGAFSCLLGATGNSKDYEPYLEAVGAADERDDIFASSCYCPITNLDNADAAYEWQFNTSTSFERRRGAPPPSFSDEDKRVSKDLKAMFPAYLNSLGLVAYETGTAFAGGSRYRPRRVKKGTILTLNEEGSGSFRDFVVSFVIESAQTALNEGQDLSTVAYLSIEGDTDTVTDIDFRAYSNIRMKKPPAFDALAFGTPETSVFGTESIDKQHFTEYASANDASRPSLAHKSVVKMMNPVYYLGAPETTTAQYWRIRHGTEDRHTSLAIPVILATILKNNGLDVDFALPWNTRHGGHYDLDELFTWMDKISKP